MAISYRAKNAIRWRAQRPPTPLYAACRPFTTSYAAMRGWRIEEEFRDIGSARASSSLLPDISHGYAARQPAIARELPF